MNIDKVKELYVGQEFKNYKYLCEFLGEKIKSGKGSPSRMTREYLR